MERVAGGEPIGEALDFAKDLCADLVRVVDGSLRHTSDFILQIS